MGQRAKAGSRTWVASLLAATSVFLAPAAQAGDPKPNVVFILADNVGYGDLGPYGGGELRGAADADGSTSSRTKGCKLTQYLGRTSLHAVAGGAHDRSIFDPQRPVAHHRSGHRIHPFRARLHDGRYVPRPRLRHRNFRQVASWLRAAEPADCARLRGVLRHPPRHFMGLGHLCRTRSTLTHSFDAPHDALVDAGAAHCRGETWTALCMT